MNTSAALARNGTRQPHARNSVSLKIAVNHMKMPVEQDEAQRGAELREHAVPALLAARRVLRGEQHRAAPFAAEAESLPETAQCEQRRRRDADAWRRWAAGRWPPWIGPSSAARRRAWPCGRSGRRNGRTGRNPRAARRTRARTSRAIAAAPTCRRRPGRTAAETRSRRPCRRCRSRRTRSSCRSGSRTAPDPWSNLRPARFGDAQGYGGHGAPASAAHR